MPKYKLMVARFPGVGFGGGCEHMESSGWVMKQMRKWIEDARISDILTFCRSDTPIDMVRNLCVFEAQQAGADYLLMIDADMAPDSELGEDQFAKPFWESSWEFMLEHRDPCVIAAPYVGPAPHENIYIFRWVDWESHAPDAGRGLNQFTRPDAAYRTGIEEVAALPTGLILYDMRVFKNMKHPYFYYEKKDVRWTEKGSTEDVTNTRDLSLAWYVSHGNRGGKVYCNWDAWAGHLKLKCCRKPRPVCVNSVAENIRDAVLGGRDAGLRLQNFGPLNGANDAALRAERWSKLAAPAEPEPNGKEESEEPPEYMYGVAMLPKSQWGTSTAITQVPRHMGQQQP